MNEQPNTNASLQHIIENQHLFLHNLIIVEKKYFTHISYKMKSLFQYFSTIRPWILHIRANILIISLMMKSYLSYINIGIYRNRISFFATIFMLGLSHRRIQEVSRTKFWGGANLNFFFKCPFASELWALAPFSPSSYASVRYVILNTPASPSFGIRFRPLCDTSN